ncbi:serine palmitoyltransferase 1 [Pelomyxa schiedti]|nr:serine palmitoyltransferase 1 [Pelomyxa schiedti]
MKLRHKEQGALTNLASTTTASFYSLWVAFVGHVWSVLLRFFDVVTPPLIRFVLAVSGLPRIVTLWLVQLFTLKLSGFIIRSFAEMEYSDTGKVFCWFPRAYLLVGVRVHTVLGYTWHLGRVLTMELLHRLYVRGMVTCNTVTVAQPSDEISDTTTLYIRRMYFAISDIFNRPISGGPGSWVPVMNRKWEGDVLNNNLKLVLTGEERKCLNLSSYNYLGFGGFHPTVTPLIEETLRSTPISLAAPRIMKCSDEQLLAELKIARFVGKEDAFIVPMGFCTNSTVIPQLVGERCLILSDYFNHASIISGTRLSKATVRIFKHNNMHDLQMHLDLATSEISSGKQHWRKIMIIVEGLYSMEGDLCPLPQLVELKKLYGAYLYVDEAHSIGAVGPSGKGVCDFYGVDPNQVDILMGTFTKSFASIGGYVAGSRDLISHLRTSSAAAVHGTPLPPPCARQICEVIDALSSDDGRQQIAQLHKNSTLFRQGLANMGCWILGNPNSPVVPILLHHPNKITAFSRQCLENSIAVVCVGYPATQLFYARARFCISSAHKEEDLYEALAKIAPVVKSVGVDYFKYWTRTPKNEDLHVSKRPGLIPSSFEPLRPSLSVFPHSPPVSSLVDFYSFDFLGLSDEATTKEACAKTMKLYGCGACGPRGFYGTTAEHLALDKALAEFTNTEQAVVYSYGLSVMSSVLPALLPQVIVYDSAANFSIMMGIQLAKCPNFSFNHNDMNSLGQVLEVGQITQTPGHWLLPKVSLSILVIFVLLCNSITCETFTVSFLWLMSLCLLALLGRLGTGLEKSLMSSVVRGEDTTI